MLEPPRVCLTGLGEIGAHLAGEANLLAPPCGFNPLPKGSGCRYAAFILDSWVGTTTLGRAPPGTPGRSGVTALRPALAASSAHQRI